MTCLLFRESSLLFSKKYKKCINTLVYKMKKKIMIATRIFINNFHHSVKNDARNAWVYSTLD